jgi:hypothetical protein
MLDRHRPLKNQKVKKYKTNRIFGLSGSGNEEEHETQIEEEE